MGLQIRFVGDFLSQGLPLPELVQSDICRDPVDPGVKARFRTKTTKGAIGFQKRLLQDILGLLAVAKHMKRKPEDMTIVTVHQLLEGLAIAALSLLDQQSFFIQKRF